MKRPHVVRYSSAVASTGLATVARLALDPFLGARFPFVTYYAAVLFTAWYGGAGPAILAVVLGSLLSGYLFIAPLLSFRIAVDAALGLALFNAAGLAVIFYTRDRRAGRARLEREVVQRCRAETERRDEGERLRVTLECVGDGVIVTDAAGRVAMINPAAECLLGWSSADAAGRPLAEVFRRIDVQTRAEVEVPAPEVLREGSALGPAGDSLLVARDGTARPIDESVAPIRDPDGEITGLVVIFRDVTDRKRAEEATREADRRKDEFLATLAHELRNPLAPIRTGLQILKHTEGDNPAVEPLRAMMDRQAEHLARLVDDLMDLSRISHGTIELRKEVVGLASVVDEAVAATRPSIDERGHELSVGVPDGEERLEADPTRLEQVLANLLTNAAKYTDPGGTIRLDARREGDEVVIRVEDTGIGIAPEMLPKVFDMFVQVERRLDRSQGGLGIGLSLVKNLVEMHGGSVTAHSEGPGKGSEFVVRLPAIAGRARRSARADPSTPGRRRPASRRGESHPRRRRQPGRGGQPRQVPDEGDGPAGRGRLRRAGGGGRRPERSGPRSCSCDIGLPGMSGYEVAERLRERAGDRGGAADRPDRVGAGGGPASVQGGGHRFPPGEARGPRRHARPAPQGRVDLKGPPGQPPGRSRGGRAGDLARAARAVRTPPTSDGDPFPST